MIFMTRSSSIFDHTSHVFRKYLRPRTNKNELVVEMLVMQQNHSFCHVFFTSQPSHTKSQTTKLQEKSVQKSTFCGASIRLRFGSVLASEHSPQTIPSSTQNRKKTTKNRHKKRSCETETKILQKCHSRPSKSLNLGVFKGRRDYNAGINIYYYILSEEETRHSLPPPHPAPGIHWARSLRGEGGNHFEWQQKRTNVLLR